MRIGIKKGGHYEKATSSTDNFLLGIGHYISGSKRYYVTQCNGYGVRKGDKPSTIIKIGCKNNSPDHNKYTIKQ
jgi:hypothetical protein